MGFDRRSDFVKLQLKCYSKLIIDWGQRLQAMAAHNRLNKSKKCKAKKTSWEQVM